MSATATQTATAQPVLSLKTNPLYNEKTHLIEKTAAQITSQTYGDWRDELNSQGYCVVKGAISAEKAQAYREDIFNWMKSLRPNFDENDKSTWTPENLPGCSKISTYTNYCVPHEDFFWRLRNEPGFKDAFAKYWGDDKLLVSFDAINVSLPGYKSDDLKTTKPWPHVDSSPYRNGLTCIQGIAALAPAGEKDGSLIVYKNSHKYIEEFFKNGGIPEEKWHPADNVQLSTEELENFLKLYPDVEKLKVHVEPGDLILWDSRTIHYGAAPDDDSDVIRTIAYISYSPASFATEEALAAKNEVFKQWGGTTHWAFDNINARLFKATLPNGELDPADRTEPLHLPELSDEILKLAGAKRY
ncbi:hypothetical protein WICPIJ_003088 [Wickerhamomyces pijperi]|uniref:Phytanoyl-CoA dioxygenase n=1 Tax=Wickerhamomyces pijperi TaxID=599730 RepID=A0A9P8QAL1_WICPI|nr:hypothetical protein WICPIJ_003088 [Wickerhamomyces pijperi]